MTGQFERAEGMAFRFVVRVIAIAGAISACSANAQESDYAQWFPGSSSTREVELFPFGFRGSWAPSNEACRDPDGVELMEIYPDGVDFYEGGGRLERITQSGQDRTVKVKLSFEGEGEFWDAIWLIMLEPGSKLLRVSDDGTDWKSYQRCE
jgi:hypothetical protein